MNRQSRTNLYAKYSRASEVPLMVLALLMIPALLLPEIFTLTPRENELLEWASWAIYAFFAADLLFKLYLAPSALAHVRSHWLDVLVVLLPLLRPLRVLGGLRILQLVRALPIIVFAATGLRRLRALFVRRNLDLVILLAIGVMLVSAALVYGLERNTASAIDSFGDALWWALATVTTVGYGDTVPQTVEARVVAVVLMITGITLFSILTANIAAFFVETDETKANKEMQRRLDIILSRIEGIERALRASEPPQPERGDRDGNSKLSEYDEHATVVK